jgi:pyrimidine deaminase RibD-like protein
LSEEERKRHGIYDNLLGEIQRNLRLLFPGLTPTLLDTSTYEKFETDMWMLPQSDDITRVYVKIKDLNHRLKSVQRDGFKENDLWMELRNEVPALQRLLINGRRPAASSTNNVQSEDDKFMRMAIEEARLSRSEDARPHPRVGVVVVKDGIILKQAHRGELALGDHAEYTALERKLGDKNLTGGTIFTTLEPCTKRGHEKTPCAERIVLRRLERVVIGMLDPNPVIQGKGVYTLKEGGVQVAFCNKQLEDEIKQLNQEFIRDQSNSMPGELPGLQRVENWAKESIDQ